jgi:hypothetical protein
MRVLEYFARGYIGEEVDTYERPGTARLAGSSRRTFSTNE